MNDEEVRILITCHHVIPDKTTAENSSFMFNYIDAQFQGKKIKGGDLFDMKAGESFWTNEVRKFRKCSMLLTTDLLHRISTILLLDWLKRS